MSDCARQQQRAIEPFADFLDQRKRRYRACMAARAGGAAVVQGAMRALFWGALAMALTAGVGMLFGAPV